MKLLNRQTMERFRPNVLVRIEDRRRERKIRRERWNLQWRLGPPCPLGRVEAGGAQIGEKVYVVGGYARLDIVVSRIDVLDLERDRWLRPITMPDGVAQTHQGVVVEANRYLYILSGQVGANCSGATKSCVVYDVRKNTWNRIPDLPAARYAPMAHVWNNRIHLMGGSQEDRHTPADQHWSIAVQDGMCLEEEWRAERPIPSSGTHRGSEIVDDCLYTFGNQKGDVKSIAGNAQCECDWSGPMDQIVAESYKLSTPGADWQEIAPMPVAITHTEHSCEVIDRCIWIFGGVREARSLTDLVLVYDTRTDQWREAGVLPYPMKSKVVARHNGWLYVISGQRSVSDTLLRPGRVVKTVWKLEL